MKAMNKSIHKLTLTVAILLIAFMRVNSQATLPDDLIKTPLTDQLKYLEERTRIYENYRAIREDMFQKLKENVTDTVVYTKKKISGLNASTKTLNQRIDSLNSTLNTTKTMLDEMTATKNSIEVLGMEVNKISYNGIMWTIIIGLICALVFGFLAFKRNLSVTQNTKKELIELKDEFETYRKTSREAREKMSMDHFNEIRRLKGG
jgi:tetrahydromethanopterin S-methyltransferase subunit B